MAVDRRPHPLISAQVNTQRGVPLLEAVTFGTFAEVQRAASAIGAVRDGWPNYVALQEVRARNERCSRRSPRCASAAAGTRARAAVAHAAGAARLQGQTLRRRPRPRSSPAAQPRVPDHDDRQGHGGRPAPDMAVIAPGRRGRPHRHAERRARQGAAAHRPRRRGRRAGRALPGPGRRGRDRRTGSG